VNDLILELASALAALGPSQTIPISGAWSTSRRKTYANPSQEGTGVGPFVEVVDARWRGTLTCAASLAGLAFLDTPAETFWVKALATGPNPTVGLSVHARAGHLPGRASFTGSLFGAVLPAVPFECGDDPTQAFSVDSTTMTTSSPHALAEVAGAALVILVFPKTLVNVGRNRLWHFRPDHASFLDGRLGVLARGRTGTIQ